MEPAGVRRLLERAKELDPKQWSIWMAESAIRRSESGSWVDLGKDTEALARRAVELNSNPFTNSQLAYALDSRAVWDNNKRFHDQAIVVYGRAENLAPVHILPRVALLDIYRNSLQNKAKSQKTQQAILATIPPKIRLSASAKSYLRQKGIPIPMGR